MEGGVKKSYTMRVLHFIIFIMNFKFAGIFFMWQELLCFKEFSTFMNKENVHRVIQFKKNCNVLYRGYLGFIHSKCAWFCLQNISENSQVFWTGGFQLSISSSIVNKHFPYPYKQCLEDMELYLYTFSTNCPSGIHDFSLYLYKLKVVMNSIFRTIQCILASFIASFSVECLNYAA